MGTRLGTKGQVVIDKRIRDELGIGPGYVSVQRRVGEGVEIRFYPPEHDRSLRGLLRRSIRAKVPRERWREAEDTAWEEAARVAEREGGHDDA